MRLLKAVGLLILFFLAVTFSLQNAQEVEVQYFGLLPPKTVPLFVVVLISVFVGILIGGVGGLITNLRLRRELRRRTREEKRLQEKGQLPQP